MSSSCRLTLHCSLASLYTLEIFLPGYSTDLWLKIGHVERVEASDQTLDFGRRPVYSTH